MTIRKRIFPFVIFALLIVPVAVFSQLKIFSIDAIPKNSSELEWEIVILMSSTPRDDVTNVTVLDAISGDRIHISDIIYVASTAPGKVDGFRIPTLRLKRGTNYVVVVTVVFRKPNGQFDKVETISTPVSIPATVPAPVPPPSPPVTILKPIKSKEKKDSDIYIAGEFVTGRGSKPAYSIDIKIEPRFGPGKWDYSPFFNLNASTSQGADPDSMNFGFKVARSYPFEYKTEKWRPRITSLYFSTAGKFEAERDFDNVNLTFNPILDFIVSTIPIGRKTTLTFTPFIGAELGKNLKSPLVEAEGGGVARFLGGSRVLLDIPIERGINNITFSAQYTRRWLLARELRYKTADDDTLVLVEFGKRPREYFESKVDVGINKFFSPYIGYDFGELPPSFKYVNHRIRIGFLYKFRFSNK